MATTYTLRPPKHYRARFKGTTRLFRACWSQYLRYLQGSIDDPRDDEEVHSWLQTIAIEKVNNPTSKFYITG